MFLQNSVKEFRMLCELGEILNVFISVFNLTERTVWEEDDGADGDVERGLHGSGR